MSMPSSPWPDVSIPGSLSTRSRSSTGSWDWETTSTSSQGNTPPSQLAQACWALESRLYGSSSHRSVWENCNQEKLCGPELYDNDDIFWQEPSNAGAIELQGEKPDLLDRLVMEDQEEKMMNSKYRMLYQRNASQFRSVEVDNLMKLLQLQQMSRDIPEGRPVFGSHAVTTSSFGTHAMPSSSNSIIQRMPTQDNGNLSTRYSNCPIVTGKGRFPPMNFKVPPPEHPPAVPVLASTHHITSNIKMKHPSPACPPSPGSAASILLRVEEAAWQFQSLEKERKKTEAALAKQNPGKRVSSNNAVQVPRLPLSPTKLDKLLVDSLREQARVLTLLNRVEVIKNKSFGEDQYSDLAMWKQKIQVVMMIRRRERMKQGEDNGEMLDEAIAIMSAASRKIRTVLWIMSSRGSSY